MFSSKHKTNKPPSPDLAGLKERLQEFKDAKSIDLDAIAQEFAPKLDASKVQQIKDSLVGGREVKASELRRVLVTGTREERTALRDACATPSAIAHNQDLNLPKLARALEGDKSAREAYEANRLITLEALPEWGLALWQRELSGAWRTFNFAAHWLSEIARELKRDPILTIGPYDPDALPDSDAKIRFSDERAAFLTFAVGIRQVQSAMHAAKHQEKNILLVNALAAVELSQGFRFLISSSPIGSHYRKVVEHELRMQYSMQLVEDACIVLELPLSVATKENIWRRITPSPGILLPQLKLRRLLEPLQILRSEGLPEELVSATLDDLLFTPGTLNKFHEDRKPKPAFSSEDRAAQRRAAIEAAKASAREVIVRRRKQGLLKALADSPFAETYDADRQVRILMKYCADSKVLYERAIQGLDGRDHPNGLVAELQARRSHISFQRDPDPDVHIEEESFDAPSATLSSSPAAKVSSHPVLSKKLIFKATLEMSLHAASIDIDRTARILAKLTNESEPLYTRAINLLERGDPPDSIITMLRSIRSNRGEASDRGSFPAPSMSKELMQALDIGVVDTERDETRFSFTIEAEKALKDGRARHAVHAALERFAERPELSDIKKIRSEDNIWELRLLRENLRVYYVTLSQCEVLVLLSGSKERQDHDIERLPAILARYQHSKAHCERD